MGTLVNRSRIGGSVKNNLKTKFDKLAEDTRISKSKLLDEALELLLKNHGVDVEEI
ncbi:ribbon-helix-helix domain-containing protein [Clostridium estertheticum]|uniref:ribbon-helix-helix domain-containing protein n=1 Tax=Clostridium estertheticum TaxID=238834 RepID=UPI0013EEC3EC|nr:ribbon-helix-helix domain-containing protein [Clostridium estertheticum]MBZ9608611.1 ribbon-helix-helix domain-containing protein [Clostridium estertheticum]